MHACKKMGRLGKAARVQISHGERVRGQRSSPEAVWIV